jgi:hypothetical protein
MRYIGIIILLVLCLTLLLLTGCVTNTVTPEIANGNSGNQTSNNPNSNNYQNPSTDPVEEPATVEPATGEVDTTKPVITGSRAPLPNSFGWNNTDVTVSFSCADTGAVKSGIAINTVAGKTLTTEGKDQSVTNTGVCTDAAGNTADPVTVSNIHIDKTPPVVTITLPGTGEYVLNQSITASWSATDALSGVVSPASGSVSIDTTSLETKTFTLPAGTVTDKAGNSSLEVTISYSVIADTEEPATEEPGTVYPQKWATGTGTVGDPWTNSCIESAYTACPTGGTVYLRAGYYVLSTAVQVTKQVNIIGEGRNKTIIITADAFGFNINPADYVTLKGFTIDGAAQTDGAEAGYLSPINIAHSDYILLEDIETKNAGYYGIGLYECNHSLLQNIYAHDNYRHGVCSASDTTGRNMYNTYRDIYAWDNGVEGFDDRGIQAATIPEAHYNVYDNLQCWDNGMHGIALTHQGGIVLSNSVVSGNGVDGIYLNAIEDSTINNCSVTLSGLKGIMLTGASKNVNFTNVIVKNNSTGIAIYNCSDIALTACQSYDDRDTPLQAYGIELTGANTNISLVNCKLTPNKEGEICNPAGVVLTVIIQ